MPRAESADRALRLRRRRGVSQVSVACAVIFLAATIACSVMLRHGAPNGHSIAHNLVWSRNFAAQLLQGDLYPRWLMSMNRGAGSPAFYFYGPLPFYVGTLPALLFPSASAEIQLAWCEWLLIALSGLSFFFYAKPRFNTVVATFAAVLYMTLPFHFEIDLWRRQDLGELGNYIWMPLILHYTERMFTPRPAPAGLALSFAMMLFTHLPSALLFTLCLCPYVFARMTPGGLLSGLPRWVAAIAIGVMLAAIYWLPALSTQQYVHIDMLWMDYYDFHHWMFPLDQRLYRDPVSATFITRLTAAIAVSSLIFALSWLSSRAWQKSIGRRAAIACLLLAATAWFLMSSWSVFVWDHFPQLAKVQFPWRVSSVVDLAAGIAALQAAQAVYDRREVLGATAIIACALLMAWSLATADFRALFDPFLPIEFSTLRDNIVQHALEVSEYQTVWNPSKDPDMSLAVAGRSPVSLSGKGKVNALRWDSQVIELRAELPQPTVATVRQYFYPSWRATMDNDKVISIHPSSDNGLMMLDLPAGSHRIKIKRVLLKQEQIGAILSASAVVLLLGWSILGGAVRYRNAIHTTITSS